MRVPHAFNSSRVQMLAGLSCMILALLATPARAELTDEIQVYTDDINKPGDVHLELHLNTTPQGRTQPDYAGEITPNHGTRITPEFSYGLTPTLEGGFYIPGNLQSDGHYAVAGAKLRLKWLPLQPQDHAGWFAGENIELSDLARGYAEPRWTMELRGISGYHGGDWLIAFNPILGFDLSPIGDRSHPDFNIGLKLARRVADGVAVGPEYYSDFGRLGQIGPWGQQKNTVFLVTDIDRGPLPFQFGVGRGVSPGADRWTIKAIIEFAFN